MKKLILLVAMMFSLPVFAEEPLYTVSTDDAVIYRDAHGPKKDVISYGIQGHSLMAWEVVRLKHGIFLNYSRFPFGDVNEKSTVCTFVKDGHKVIGVGDSQIHLAGAVIRIAKDSGIKGAINPTCASHRKLIEENPAAAKVSTLWSTLK